MRAAQDVDVLSDTDDGDRPPSGRRPLASALVAGLVVVIIDQLTKAWAMAQLVDGPCGPDGEGCIQLIGSLRLHLVFNPGAAFSTGIGLGPLFGLIAPIMAAFLLHLARYRTDRFGPVVLGVVAGGAVGNLIDRVVRAEDGFLTGHVVDFVDLQWWPVFNVADTAVVVGIIVFAVLMVREGDTDTDAGSNVDSDSDDLDTPTDSDGAADAGGRTDRG